MGEGRSGRDRGVGVLSELDFLENVGGLRGPDEIYLCLSM